MYSFCVYIHFSSVSIDFRILRLRNHYLEKYIQNRYERLQARYAAQIREKVGMVELPMQVIFDWLRNKPIRIQIEYFQGNGPWDANRTINKNRCH